VPKDKLASLNTVHIAARWDGATQPAIDVPILAMFAAVRGPVAGSSLALASTVDGNDQVLSLRLPMPFRTTAVWTLSNAGPEAAAFALEWIGEAKLPGDDFGHLNLQYNEAPLPPAQIAQLVAQANARGRFVGLCADLDGHSEASVVGDAYGDPLNLVGGDVNVTSDGQVSLASVTTDSYVDNAYYFLDSPKSTPFAQNWNRVDNASAQPPGQISFCRWHVLGNEVDFQHDLKVTRNAARRDLSTVDLHRTVAYLYLP
jgi:hypothetical protein